MPGTKTAKAVSTQDTAEKAVSPFRQRFVASLTRLVGIDADTQGEFHCDPCKAVFVDIQEKARLHLADEGNFSNAQLDYARHLFSGEARCVELPKGEGSSTRHDPEGEVEVKCLGHWKKQTKTVDGNKVVKNVKVNCDNVITGTRKEIGERGTQCDKCRKASAKK